MTSQGSQQLYIFIQCGRLCILFIFLFKPSLSVMDQKLKWNVRLALDRTSYMHFIIYRQLVLSLFLYKISCDRTDQVRVFWLKTFGNCVMYQSLWLFLCKGWGGGGERGTQQENSYTKYAVTNRLPVRVTFGRVKQLSILLTTCFVKCFLRRRQLLRIRTD
jgi:hypothetical protein